MIEFSLASTKTKRVVKIIWYLHSKATMLLFKKLR